MTFDIAKPEEIEKHLSSNAYLCGEVPSAEDCALLMSMKAAPSKASHPNFFHYYNALAMFKPEVMKAWKKVAAKAEAEDEDDLFGSDSDDEEVERAREERIAKAVAEQAAKKAKKPTVIAKSIVIIDVKVFEMEQDLEALSKEVFKIEMDGLVWNKEPKFVEVAFGMKKLQVGCVIEDDKVLTDDLFELIEKIGTGEEIQSLDIASMQKL